MLTTALPAQVTVLIVDDNEDAADLLQESLRELGYTTVVAHDGPAALRAIEGLCPDVALLDLGLPQMDGFELAARLRANPSLGALKLVAVTGYGQESDRRRSAEAGFAEYLVKPVSVAQVQEAIARLTMG
jgi:CheY-like chemotaxis protein